MKRTLSVFLTIVMLLSLLPMQVYAEGAEPIEIPKETTENQIIPVESIRIEQSEGEYELYPDELLQLTAYFLPDGSTTDVLWVSSDSEIASVDENGVVSGNAVGTVQVYASADDGNLVSNTLDITVVDASQATLSLNGTGGDEGGTLRNRQ